MRTLFFVGDDYMISDGTRALALEIAIGNPESYPVADCDLLANGFEYVADAAACGGGG